MRVIIAVPRRRVALSAFPRMHVSAAIDSLRMPAVTLVSVIAAVLIVGVIGGTVVIVFAMLGPFIAVVGARAEQDEHKRRGHGAATSAALS